jgi:UDP-GlcNAc:undecaprenyl-phosphate/decaprenyl-phosphate GlcNAc-1-phosphate transferase
MHSDLKPILIFLVALLGALFVLPKLSIIAKKIGLLDLPNHRKVHTTPRPLVGGIGMMISATFTSLLFIPLSGLRGFFSGLSVLLLIGFLDDFKEMGHRQKFLAQIFACALLIYFSKTTLVSFGNLLGLGDIVMPWAWLAWITTVFCVVGVINALNLIDGLDGLAGGISFVAFILFAAHASLAENNTYMFLNLAFAGSVLGFLRYNWSPASLFMGDAGSLCIGFTLAFMAISMSQGDEPIIQPITALLILAVPIVDTLTIMSKRVLSGGSPFQADQHHLHHIFLRHGLSREQTAKVIIGISMIMGSLSLLSPIYHLPDYTLFAFFSFYFILYFCTSFYILTLIRYSLRLRRKRGRCGLPLHLISFFFNSFDWMRIFRKSARYCVSIPFSCYDPKHDQNLQGTILNLSQDGFMALIPEIHSLGTQITLTISITHTSSKQKTLTISAEHLWISELQKQKIHGYRFLQLDNTQRENIKILLLQATLQQDTK